MICQVEACTAHVSRYIPKFLKEAPTAKVFLRSFWYRCLLGGVAGPEEMHVYTLARSAPDPRSYPRSSS